MKRIASSRQLAQQVQELLEHGLPKGDGRTGTTREGILCAWGIIVEGRRVLLHLALGNKESHANWLEFLRDMVSRALSTPLTVTADGALPGGAPAHDGSASVLHGAQRSRVRLCGA